MAASPGEGSLDWASVVTSDWLRGRFWHSARPGAPFVTWLCSPVERLCVLQSTRRPFFFFPPLNPQLSPDPLGPPMSKKSVPSFWCSAFWMWVNTKWNVENATSYNALQVMPYTAFVSGGCFLSRFTVKQKKHWGYIISGALISAVMPRDSATYFFNVVIWMRDFQCWGNKTLSLLWVSTVHSEVIWYHQELW